MGTVSPAAADHPWWQLAALERPVLRRLCARGCLAPEPVCRSGRAGGGPGSWRVACLAGLAAWSDWPGPRWTWRWRGERHAGPGSAPAGAAHGHGAPGRALAGGGFELSSDNPQFQADDGLPGLAASCSCAIPGPTVRGVSRASCRPIASIWPPWRRLPAVCRWMPPCVTPCRPYAPQGLVQQLQAGWHGPLAQPRPPAARQGERPGHCRPGQESRGRRPDWRRCRAGSDAAGRTRAGYRQTDGCCCPVCSKTRCCRAAVVGHAALAGRGQRIAVQTNDRALPMPTPRARRAWPGARRTPPHHRHARAFRACWSPATCRAPTARACTATCRWSSRPRRATVRDAIQTGSAPRCSSASRAICTDFPYGHAPRGEFHIAARVTDVTYAYVSPSACWAGDRPGWC